MSDLEVKEGLGEQSTDESISYSITTTNWGTSPTDVNVVAYDMTTRADVTSTVFPVNSPSVNGDIITLSPLKNLTRNHRYRVEVEFTANGNIFECYFLIDCVM